jgi:hypothetical protein
MDPEELIDIALDDSERNLLRCGVMEWGGPAYCTDEMAVAMGFASVEDFFAESHGLFGALTSRQPMTGFDWLRVLLATEIVFASNVVGSGLAWPTTTGLSDAASIATLRRVQRKLAAHGVMRHRFGTRPQRSG